MMYPEPRTVRISSVAKPRSILALSVGQNHQRRSVQPGFHVPPLRAISPENEQGGQLMIFRVVGEKEFRGDPRAGIGTGRQEPGEMGVGEVFRIRADQEGMVGQKATLGLRDDGDGHVPHLLSFFVSPDQRERSSWRIWDSQSW